MTQTRYIRIDEIDTSSARSVLVDTLAWRIKAEAAAGNQNLVEKLVEEANTLPITVVQVASEPDRYRLVDGLMKIAILRDVLERTTILADLVDADDPRANALWHNISDRDDLEAGEEGE